MLPYFVLQSETAQAFSRSKEFLFFLRLLDDLLEEVEIGGKRLPAGAGERISGHPPARFHAFGESHVARFMERAEVGGDVAIGHFQGVTDVAKRHFRGGRQQGHDGKPPLLVNNTIEFEKWLWIHALRLRSVK